MVEKFVSKDFVKKVVDKKYGVRNRARLRSSHVASLQEDKNFNSVSNDNADVLDSVDNIKPSFNDNVVEDYDCVLSNVAKSDFEFRKKQLDFLKKTNHNLARFDNRKEAISFDSSGDIVFEKSFSPDIQIKNVNNVDFPDEIDEKFLAGKHLFIVDSSHSRNLFNYVKFLLPHSYMNGFGDICFFETNGIEVILRGPFVLSKTFAEKLGVGSHNFDNKHIWVFDCPKVRVISNDLQFQDFLLNDPFVRAFGFPSPEGVELEGLEILVKLARKTGAKILASDTGNFFDVAKPVNSFVWRVGKILPPNFISDVLVEVFGVDGVDGIVSPPEVFETNFSDYVVEDLNVLFDSLGKDFSVPFHISDLSEFAYLFTRLFWKYDERVLGEANTGVGNVEGENVSVVNNSSVDIAFNVSGDGKSLLSPTKVTKNWVDGYGFAADFGFGSRVAINTSGNVDVEYRVVDGVSVAFDDSVMFEYVFSWLPRDFSVLSRELSPSMLRERELGLLLLHSVGLKLQSKYGGVLLNSDLLPL